MSGRVRPAAAADLETVAAIHARAWREAYAGLIPEPGATGIWHGLDGAGVPAGFVAGGPRRPDGPDAEAEFHALCVLARARGQRLGRALMARGRPVPGRRGLRLARPSGARGR